MARIAQVFVLVGLLEKIEVSIDLPTMRQNKIQGTPFDSNYIRIKLIVISYFTFRTVHLYRNNVLILKIITSLFVVSILVNSLLDKCTSLK